MNLACVFYCSLVEEEEKKKDDKGEKDKVEAGKSKREAIQVSAPDIMAHTCPVIILFVQITNLGIPNDFGNWEHKSESSCLRNCLSSLLRLFILIL